MHWPANFPPESLRGPRSISASDATAPASVPLQLGPCLKLGTWRQSHHAISVPLTSPGHGKRPTSGTAICHVPGSGSRPILHGQNGGRWDGIRSLWPSLLPMSGYRPRYSGVCSGNRPRGVLFDVRASLVPRHAHPPRMTSPDRFLSARSGLLLYPMKSHAADRPASTTAVTKSARKNRGIERAMRSNAVRMPAAAGFPAFGFGGST